MAYDIEIAGRKIGPYQPVFCIAEIGQNHNGDARLANKLWGEAFNAGFDAVKFQKRDLAHEYTDEFGSRPYNSEHSFGPTYHAHRTALEFSVDDLHFIKRRATQHNDWQMPMIVTPCHPCVVDQLEMRLDPPAYKIASRDIDNVPLLKAVADTGKPVIVSTGMATDGEIDMALDVMRRRRVVLMHCTSAYPCQPETAQLRRIEHLMSHGCPVGWSDHTPGIALVSAAVALGACILEKHITFARAAKGSDHAGSLEPPGMRRYIEHVRATEQAMCRDIQVPHPATKAAQAKLRRSLVLREGVPAGTLLTQHHFDYLSPGTGLGWHERLKVVGRVTKTALPKGHIIQPQDVAALTEAAH